jgi:uncharacterized membrane protein YqhA
VAISAIELLKAFVRIGTVENLGAAHTWSVADQTLAWKVGIHAVLVVSGLLFALMDKTAESAKRGNGSADEKH